MKSIMLFGGLQMKRFKVMCIITVIGIILILCISLFPYGEVKRTNYSIEKNERKITMNRLAHIQF